MKQSKYLFSTVFVAALLSGVASDALAQKEITLLAPSSSRRALNRILPNLEAETGYMVQVTYARARTSTHAVAKGEATDVSIVVAPVTGVLTSGVVIPSSMTLVASYLTAGAVPNGAPEPDISTGEAVKEALLAAKSVGYEDPDFATAGQGPAEAIYNVGIADQIAAKSTLCAGNTTYSPTSTCFDPANTDGRSTLTIQKGLINGDIDIGMLYLSDMFRDQDKFTIVGVLPLEIYTPVAIAGFISTHASDPAAARAILQYLVSPDAQAIFEEMGFEAGNR